MNIPPKVQKAAALGVKMKENGYAGATETGIMRGLQLSRRKTIPLETLKVMNAWFARHGPDASNGGTSFRGYCKWLMNGSPTDGTGRSKYRGAVSWLLWGGDDAYLWLKSPRVQRALSKEYPDAKLLNQGDNRSNACDAY